MVATRRGEMTAPARVGDDDPAGHRLRAVPLGRRQPAHQRRARPDLADAGVQGLRRAGERPHEASSSSATAWPRPGWSRSSCARRHDGQRHRRRRRAAPGVQPDPALRGARGHPPDRRAHPARPELYAAARRRGAHSAARVAAASTASAADGRARRRHRELAYDTSCSPPAASRPCRRSAAWSGSTAAAREGARLPQPGRLPAARWRACRTPSAPSSSAAACSASRSPAALAVRGLAIEVVEGGRPPAVAARSAPRRGGPGRAPRAARHRGLHRRPRRPADRRRPAPGQRRTPSTPTWWCSPPAARPSTALARRAGLMVRRGIVVDDHLRTVTDGDLRDRRLRRAPRPDHRLRRRRPGSRPACWPGVLDRRDAEYDGSRIVARLRATGLDVAVLGDPEHTDGRDRRARQPGHGLATASSWSATACSWRPC